MRKRQDLILAFIKPFRTCDRYYLYSSLTNRIARVSERIFGIFEQAVVETENRRVGHEAKRIGDLMGLLPERAPQPATFPPERIRRAMEHLRLFGPRYLILSITEQCNFRCRYCVHSGAYRDRRVHSDKTMTFETIRKALTWYFSFKRGEYQVGFYGGEPLHRFDLIEEAIAFSRHSMPVDARLTFSVTTNGALLSDRVADFFAANDIQLHISIDGPPDVHNRYRVDRLGNPTFDVLWKRLTRLRNRHKAYYDRRVGFNITVAPPGRIEEISAFLDRHPRMFRFKVPVVSPLGNEPSCISEHLGLSEADWDIDYSAILDEYIDDCVRGFTPSEWCRGCYDDVFSTIHFRTMSETGNIIVSHGQCIPGKRCHIDANGTFHMCDHIGEGFPIGSVDTGYDESRIMNYLGEFGRLMDNTCASCWAIRLCRKCIPMLADGGSLSYRRLAEFCHQKKQELEIGLIRYCEALDRNKEAFEWMARAYQPVAERTNQPN